MGFVASPPWPLCPQPLRPLHPPPPAGRSLSSRPCYPTDVGLDLDLLTGCRTPDKLCKTGMKSVPMCGGCEDEMKSCILYVKQRGPLASSVGLFPRPKLGDYRSLVGSGVCHGATESPGQQGLWYGEAWTPGTLALTLPSKQQQVQGKRGRRETRRESAPALS